MILETKRLCQFTKVKASGRLKEIPLVQINPAHVAFLEQVSAGSTAIHINGKRLVVRGNIKLTSSRLGYKI